MGTAPARRQQLACAGLTAGWVTEVGEHREHAPVLGLRGIELELVEDAGDVLFHRCLADHERLSDAAIGLALGHRGEHVALARAEPVEWPVALTSAEHSPDDLGVKRAAAPCDAGDRVDEALYITYPLFEQVADSLRAVPDEI